MRRPLPIAFFALMLSTCVLEDDASAWILAVEDAHAALDRASGRTATLDAMEALEHLVTRAPPGVSSGDARTVRQDAYYVLASTALREGDPYAARRLASDGLRLGMRSDVLVTNLLVARGEAFEVLGEPANAANDYHRALTIASTMLDERLDRMGGSPQ